MNISTMARAYSYIRFSTPAQADGDSLRRQTELSEAYAEKHHLVFDRSLSLFDKGISAFSGDNRKKGALALFIKAVEDGIVKPGSLLLIESFDRLSRDTLSVQMTLLMNLVNAGITVVTLADEEIYSKETIDRDFSRLMTSLVIMMRSHEESKTKSRRLVESWKGKRRDVATEKMTAKCPHWLELNVDRKSFRVIEERAKIVRRIFAMNIEGTGQAAIASALNREKIPVWGRGTGWHPSYLQRLLHNPSVLGDFQPQRRIKCGKMDLEPAGDPIKGYYPAVIDIATWQRVQARQETTTPGRTITHSKGNLFSRIAFDGYTGAPMRHMRRGATKPAKNENGEPGKTSVPYYYLLSDNKRLNPDAKAVSWRYEWFEQWFLNYISGLDWQSITLEKVPIAEKGVEKKLAQARTTVDDLGLKLKRLSALAQSTDHPPQSILGDMSKLEADLAVEKNQELRLAKELEMLTMRRTVLAEEATDFKKLIVQGDVAARLRLREEIRRRITRIDIFPNGAEAEHLRGEHVRAPSPPAFKTTFVNGAIRWQFCVAKKPEADGATILHYGGPPDVHVELRERPEILDPSEQNQPPRKVLVPVYVPNKPGKSDLFRAGKTPRKRKPVLK